MISNVDDGTLISNSDDGDLDSFESDFDNDVFDLGRCFDFPVWMVDKLYKKQR